MKKQILTLALMAISFLTFAQEKFTKATMQMMLDEYKKDSKAFFKNRLSEDFIYTPPSGDYINKATVIDWPKQDILSTEILDLKIMNNGNLAVVNGTHKTQYPERLNMTKATYTFQNRNGKWLFIASQQAAQPVEPFTAAKFQEMMDRAQNDKSFFKNECDPSITLTFASGAMVNHTSMVKMGESLAGLYHRVESNVKIAQVGSTAVVTGIVDENFSKKESPNIPGPSSKYNYTYTFAAVNGKWLWMAGQHTDYMAPKADDEVAIKKLIDYERHSIAVETDYKAFLNNYKNGKDLRFGPYKNTVLEGYDALAVAAEAAVKGGTGPNLNKAEHTDWNIKRNGNSAFVTYVQMDTTPSGKIEKRFKSDYLEKINGEWKIVDHRFFLQP